MPKNGKNGRGNGRKSGGGRNGKRNGNGRKTNGRSLSNGLRVTGGTQMGGYKVQRDWTHGSLIAKPQVIKQINVFDQATWSRRTDGVQLYDLSGATTTTTRPTDFIEVGDHDFVFDLSTDLILVKGASAAAVSSVNVAIDFSAFVLKTLPIKWLQPSVQFEILQVVFTRQGQFNNVNLTTNAMPGFGFVGTMGDEGVTLSEGAQAVVRYRLYRPWLVEPLFFVPVENGLSASRLTAAPLVAWERRWKLQLPRQDAYDRFQLGMAPMTNAYTFSFVPTYPFSFSFTTSTASLLVAYAVLFDPNEATEMCAPYVGVIGAQRREALTELSGTAPAITFRFYATQRCRVYIRLTDLLGNRLSWQFLRPDIDVLEIPGYTLGSTPPTKSISKQRILRAMEESKEEEDVYSSTVSPYVSIADVVDALPVMGD
jgi:hypothetical protein